MNCPNCARPTQPGYARCGHCNYKLPQTLALAVPEDLQATVPCWNCKHSNVPEAPRCIRCNAKMENHTAPVLTTRTAPESRAPQRHISIEAPSPPLMGGQEGAAAAFCQPTTLTYYKV
jgi:uncharacterized protein with PIN domain